MNIIVCNDSRTDPFPEDFDWSQPDALEISKAIRIDCNLDGGLCDVLRNANHNVGLFDGYQDDGLTKIVDANVGANALVRKMREFGANGLVFDLQYFGNFNYGLNMLRHMRELGMISNELIIVVYTHFKNEQGWDYPHRLLDEFGIPAERIVDRLQVNISTIPQFFA